MQLGHLTQWGNKLMAPKVNCWVQYQKKSILLIFKGGILDKTNKLVIIENKAWNIRFAVHVKISMIKHQDTFVVRCCIYNLSFVDSFTTVYISQIAWITM